MNVAHISEILIPTTCSDFSSTNSETKMARCMQIAALA